METDLYDLQMAQIYKMGQTPVRTPVGSGIIETVDMLHHRVQVLMDKPVKTRTLFWFPADQVELYQPLKTTHVGTISEVK